MSVKPNSKFELPFWPGRVVVVYPLSQSLSGPLLCHTEHDYVNVTTNEKYNSMRVTLTTSRVVSLCVNFSFCTYVCIENIFKAHGHQKPGAQFPHQTYDEKNHRVGLPDTLHSASISLIEITPAADVLCIGIFFFKKKIPTLGKMHEKKSLLCEK